MSLILWPFVLYCTVFLKNEGYDDKDPSTPLLWLYTTVGEEGMGREQQLVCMGTGTKCKHLLVLP